MYGAVQAYGYAIKEQVALAAVTNCKVTFHHEAARPSRQEHLDQRSCVVG